MIAQAEGELDAAVRRNPAPAFQVTLRGRCDIAIRPEEVGIHAVGAIDAVQCMWFAKIEQDETGVVVSVALIAVQSPLHITLRQRLHVCHRCIGRGFDIPGTRIGWPGSLYFGNSERLGAGHILIHNLILNG